MNAFATAINTAKADFIRRETTDARATYHRTRRASDFSALIAAELEASRLWDRFEVLAAEFADVAADLLANGYEPHELPRLLVEHEAEADRWCDDYPGV